eukprot:Nitzschia sp. Nitz4//scaffold26_size159584//4156//5199//NITZ4_002461-RA/size159584-processed-gene-0.174-mRNA-1//1//CDS//3329544992//47//frame0
MSLPPSLQQPWFQGAPVSKLLSMFWVAGHFFFRVHKTNVAPSVPTEVSALSVLSMIFSKFLFRSTGELILGLIFLSQHLRKLERELSSQRLVVWMTFSISSVFSLCMVVYATTSVDFFDPNSTNTLPLAELPYLLMGGIQYWIYQFQPRLHPRFIHWGGGMISMSERALSQLIGGYLILARGVPGLVLATLGWMTSYLFFWPMTGASSSSSSSSGSSFSWPGPLPIGWMRQLPLETLSGVFLLDPPPRVYAPMLQQRRGGGRAGMPVDPATAAAAMAAMGNLQPQHRRNRRATPSPRPPVPVAAPQPPPQHMVDELTAMGFEEQRVREALEHSNNNMERAADRLLST